MSQGSFLSKAQWSSSNCDPLVLAEILHSVNHGRHDRGHHILTPRCVPGLALSSHNNAEDG